MNSPMPLELVTQLEKRRAQLQAFEKSKPAVRATGLAALKRLIPIAQGDTGQSVRVAHFLLGCYNGHEFPFDLTDLRALDFDIHADCMAVLQMDYAPEREIHQLIENGARIFERLAQLHALYENPAKDQHCS